MTHTVQGAHLKALYPPVTFFPFPHHFKRLVSYTQPQVAFAELKEKMSAGGKKVTAKHPIEYINALHGKKKLKC